MIVFLPMAAVPPITARAAVRMPVISPLVVVDPGHGGKDPGASAGGMTEDPINLDVGRRLAYLLRRAGYRVLLTRLNGCNPYVLAGGSSGCRINVKARVAMTLAHRANLFVSLHCDRFSSASVRGPRTYYFPGSSQGLKFARAIQQELDPFREKPLAPIPADYYVLRKLPDLPAVVVEVGFLSSPAERRDLAQPAYRIRMAKAIERGMSAYVSTTAIDRQLAESRHRSTVRSPAGGGGG